MSTSVSALSARMYLRGTSALRHLDRDGSFQERDGVGRGEATERSAGPEFGWKRSVGIFLSRGVGGWLKQQSGFFA